MREGEVGTGNWEQVIGELLWGSPHNNQKCLSPSFEHALSELGRYSNQHWTINEVLSRGFEQHLLIHKIVFVQEPK